MADDDDRDFADKEAHAKPDRSHTRGGTFATSTPVTFVAQDEFVITNPVVSGGTHTFTFTPRGSGGTSQTFTETLEAGRSCRYSGRGIQSVSIDSTDSLVTWKAGPRGTVFAVSNPSTAGGASAVANTEQAFIATPSAGGSAQMGGLGAAGNLTNALVMTPLKSGKVRLTVMLDWQQAASGDVLTGFARHGTGAPPAKNAAASGTQDTEFLDNQASGIGVQKTITVDVVIPGLTVGTAYWFDISMTITQATDAVEILSASIEELDR